MTEIKSNGDLIGTLLERALEILTTPFTFFLLLSRINIESVVKYANLVRMQINFFQ